MAFIYWLNASTQRVKWVALKDGIWQGNTLEPGEEYDMYDEGVEYAGFSTSSFTGFTTAPVPLPDGWSGVHFASDEEPSNDDLKRLRELPPK